MQAKAPGCSGIPGWQRSRMAQLDPRSVANLIIRLACERGQPTTHLALQKILYFIHGRHLIERGQPLLSGYFEAWPYGPVHPLIYDSFKDRGAQPLKEFASKRDLMSGLEIPVDEPKISGISTLIEDLAVPYLKLSPGRLVDLSHARNSPWDVLTKTASSREYGMRITDEHIISRFRFHKISVDQAPRAGEPHEESSPY